MWFAMSGLSKERVWKTSRKNLRTKRGELENDQGNGMVKKNERKDGKGLDSE